MMSTIGSSHKFPIPGDEMSSDDLDDSLGRLDIHESNNAGKETIVVFDEAGCIPAYELLGISRLKRSIKSLICVGDKHQLPPYAPDSMNNKRNSFGRRVGATPAKKSDKVDSLLDVSKLEDDGDTGGKIRLTTQYRVPRDIANVLNARIYKGNYRTAINCRVPSRGFHFVHVDYCHRSKKYENDNEVRKCLEFVELHARGGGSMMILTPVSIRSRTHSSVSPFTNAPFSFVFCSKYKKQQRKLQYALKRNGFGEDTAPVLTIDQCQGQEADIVILSLVQKPTRFLNKNRFNVALSRVRQKLYLLCNKHEFQQAAKNSSWECALLAKDLLQLATDSGGFDNSDAEDSDDYFDAYYN